MEPQFVLAHQTGNPFVVLAPDRRNEKPVDEMPDGEMSGGEKPGDEKPVVPREPKRPRDPEPLASDESPGDRFPRQPSLPSHRSGLATALSAILLIASGACATLPAQLDLNPREGVYIGEATPFPCIRFRDGGKVARFMPPAKWQFIAEGAGCAFKPAGASQAGGSMVVASLATGADAKLPERFEKLLTTAIPAGAKDINFTLDGLSTVRLDSWEARQSQVSYEHFGQKFRAALLIVPLEREELHIRFGCRAADFDTLFTPFFESLGTFVWLSAEEDRATQPR